MPRCLRSALTGFARPSEHCFHGREVTIDSVMCYMAGALAEVNPHWNLPPEGPYSNDGFVRLPSPAILANCSVFCKML